MHVYLLTYLKSERIAAEYCSHYCSAASGESYFELVFALEKLVCEVTDNLLTGALNPSLLIHSTGWTTVSLMCMQTAKFETVSYIGISTKIPDRGERWQDKFLGMILAAE